MKVAIMQPYFFPYLGYWQLMQVADVFIAFDDVNYIKRGWINRNRILLNGEPSYLTVPVVSASQNKKINDLVIMQGGDWREKMLKSIQHAYSKAPFFNEMFPLIRSVIFNGSENLSNFLVEQLKSLSSYLELNVDIEYSSASYANSRLRGEDRIIDICKRAGASIYINPPGGREMYDQANFQNNHMDLRFLEPEINEYPQRQNGFTPHLSIIDLLMELGKDGVLEQLNKYDLQE